MEVGVVDVEVEVGGDVEVEVGGDVEVDVDGEVEVEVGASVGGWFIVRGGNLVSFIVGVNVRFV